MSFYKYNNTRLKTIISSINKRNYYSISGRVAILKKEKISIMTEANIQNHLYALYDYDIRRIQKRISIFLLLLISACRWLNIFSLLVYKYLQFVRWISTRRIYEGNIKRKIWITSTHQIANVTYTIVENDR